MKAQCFRRMSANIFSALFLSLSLSLSLCKCQHFFLCLSIRLIAFLFRDFWNYFRVFRTNFKNNFLCFDDYLIGFQFIFCLDGYTTDDLVFLWKEGDPVQVTKNLHLPRFTLQKYLTAYCTSRTNTGKNYLDHMNLPR